MYTLLIVDDEYQTRNGLRELFDWEALGITVVADASDGDEALPLLEKLRPDILLTDVRMHRMDGLELARRARGMNPGMAIVFISGYSQASYLRDALHVEAADYIYKPVRIAELKATMSRLVARLDAQAQTRLLLEKSKPLLVERFLRSWFHGMVEDEQSIREKIRLLGLRFPEDGQGVVAAVFQPEWACFPDNGQAENAQILLEQTIRGDMENVLTCAEDTGVTALIAVKSAQERDDAAETLRKVGVHAQEATGVAVMIGMSLWHASWLEAPEAIREARRAVTGQAFSCEGGVLPYEEPEKDEKMTAGLIDGDLLERSLLSGNREGLQSYVEEAISGAEADAQAVRKLLMCVALQIDLTLRRLNVEEVDSLNFCRHALGSHSLLTVKNTLWALLDTACAAVERERGKKYSVVVSRVMDIMHARYGERLSVNAIAEEVHYSATHLSVLFRKETGSTLSDALLRIRLKAAMDLLRTSVEPVSAIAVQTGYADVQYFSRVFKQYTGLTPLEYRRKVIA